MALVWRKLVGYGFGHAIDDCLLGRAHCLITWVVLKLVRSGQQPWSQTPLEIAKARYARGEISKEEFEQLKKDIG